MSCASALCFGAALRGIGVVDLHAKRFRGLVDILKNWLHQAYARPGPLGLDRGVGAESIVRSTIENVIGYVRNFGDLPDEGAVS